MRIEKHHQLTVLIVEKDKAKIGGVNDMLDMMGDARYNGCDAMVIDKETLGETFFDLKTGYAGEILQKFSNYNMKIGIIGDFSKYKSKSLKDFIYESNQGNRVCFLNTHAACIEHLSR